MRQQKGYLDNRCAKVTEYDVANSKTRYNIYYLHKSSVMLDILNLFR